MIYIDFYFLVKVCRLSFISRKVHIANSDIIYVQCSLFILALGHNFSLKNNVQGNISKIFLKGQKIYCRDEKGKRFYHKWGPSSVPNLMYLVSKL